MNQLINITQNNGNNAVSARELHQFLEVDTKFSTWFERRIEEYQFVENEDFEVIPNFGKNPKGGRPLIEYTISLDMAKELSMVEKNAKGKQARRYFIVMERMANYKMQALANVQNQKTGTEYERNILAKRQELLASIRFYLKRGDMHFVSKELKLSYNAIRNVLNGDGNSENVLNALYKRALQNKNGLLIDYQKMIDTLKK